MKQDLERLPNRAISQIRRLWAQTAEEQTTEVFPTVESELQGYYAATICSILGTLDELDQASNDPNSKQQFAQRFQAVRPHIVRKLRLLTEIGRVLLPDDFLTAAEGQRERVH